MLKKLSAMITVAIVTGCCIINLSMSNMITAEAAYTANTLQKASAAEGPTIGDVDSNGFIDPLDAVTILSTVAQNSIGNGDGFTEEQMKCADVNDDGQVNASDASIVLTYSSYCGAGGSEDFSSFLDQFRKPQAPSEPVAPQEPEGIVGNIVTLTDEEKTMLAALVTLEVGSESYECQMAIASLVINRMLTSDSTLSDVIYAKNQFSVAGKVASTTPSEQCVEAVNEVLETGTTLPIYVTFFRSRYYHSWGDQVPYGIIDHTYFSYSQALMNKYI